MTREEMEMWLDSIGATYETVLEYKGTEFIYVWDTNAYYKKCASPIKYRNLYVPYIRLSWDVEDGDDMIYKGGKFGRPCYMSADEVKDVCRKLAGCKM